MSGVRHGRLAVPLLLGLAFGCAAGPLSGARPLHLSDVDRTADPARRASLELCLDGLDADIEGRVSAARSQYERAIQIDPTNPYAYLALARHETDGGDPVRALQYLDQAEALLAAEDELTPGAQAHLEGLRGVALAQSGRDGGPHLLKASELAPDAWSDGRLAPEELR